MHVPLEIDIDLLALLRQAAPQVYGSDERDLLTAFLDRCTDSDETPIIITIDLSTVIIHEKGSGGDHQTPDQGEQTVSPVLNIIPKGTDICLKRPPLINFPNTTRPSPNRPS